MSKPEYLDTLEDYVKAPVGTLIHDVPDGLYCYRKLANGYWRHDLGSDATSAVLAEDNFARKVQEFGNPSSPQVIRTVEELAALDPDTVLGVWHEELEMGCIFLEAREWILEDAIPPLAVIATAEQVRAARKALEEENE